MANGYNFDFINEDILVNTRKSSITSFRRPAALIRPWF